MYLEFSILERYLRLSLIKITIFDTVDRLFFRTKHLILRIVTTRASNVLFIFYFLGHTFEASTVKPELTTNSEQRPPFNNDHKFRVPRVVVVHGLDCRII